MTARTLPQCASVIGQVALPLDFEPDPNPTLTSCDCTPPTVRPCGHCAHCHTCQDCDRCAVYPGCICACDEEG